MTALAMVAKLHAYLSLDIGQVAIAAIITVGSKEHFRSPCSAFPALVPVCCGDSLNGVKGVTGTRAFRVQVGFPAESSPKRATLNPQLLLSAPQASSISAGRRSPQFLHPCLGSFPSHPFWHLTKRQTPSPSGGQLSGARHKFSSPGDK